MFNIYFDVSCNRQKNRNGNVKIEIYGAFLVIVLNHCIPIPYIEFQ